MYTQQPITEVERSTVARLVPTSRRVAARAAAAVDGKGKSSTRRASGDRRGANDVPGGLLTAACIEWGLVPGPKSHEMMEWVRRGVASGELQERVPTEHYLEALSHAFPRPSHAEGRDFGTLKSVE
mmetsp:Transcript_16756/g.42980  ORF Transcript_16756/g.42980 Transcript_16756/m.42980 type:complete len:126 (-) Transcript_16756:261-638(-)